MSLEETITVFKPVQDKRPMLPEPPPVRLVAIDDVHLPAAAGMEIHLDAFYVGLLKFVREGTEQGYITYKAENWRLCFDSIEPPLVRQDFRPIGIDIPSLQSFERELINLEEAFQWQKGLLPGQQTILLQDPAGNWVLVGQIKGI